MVDETLTLKKWEGFQKECLSGIKTDQKLFELSLMHAESDPDKFQKAAANLHTELQKHYKKVSVSVADVRRFFDQRWLLHILPIRLNIPPSSRP